MNGIGKHIAILGAGESGIGAAILAMKKGWNVFVSDFGTIPEMYKGVLEEKGFEWEEMKHTESRILTADLVVNCLLYTSPSPRDATLSRMPSSA